MKETTFQINSGNKAPDLLFKGRKIFTSLIFILLILFTGNSKAQWVNVGFTSISSGVANYQSLAFNDSIPYVAFQDSANGNKTTVMRFNGAEWVNVGAAGFSAGAADYQSIALDSSTPYVAYSDAANGFKTTVMKFDGANWVNVGSPGFSTGWALYQSLAFNGNTPYVAYLDGGNGSKTTVMKFDGINWVNVGTPGFSAGDANFQSLAFDGSTPYVAYQDYGNAGKTTVMKFDGANWVNVGSPGFSAGTAGYQSLAFDGSTPYVAYRDNGNGFKTTVMKFDGVNWINVGSPGFSAGDSYYQSLAINGSMPYVAYTDIAYGSKTTVMKFDGVNWINVGSPGFSVGLGSFHSMAFNGSTPFLAFRDNGNALKTTVMKFDGANWVNVGSPGFSAGSASYQSLAFNGSKPYVAFYDAAYGGKTTVIKLDGAYWVNVGSPGFSVGSAVWQSLVINDGTPYVTFMDDGIANKASVMKFDGTNWVYVGSPGFSAGISSFISMAFNGSTPYVVYRDVANGGNTTVMKFDGINWVNVGSPGFSAGSAFNQSLAFDGSTPYVAYRDGGNGSKTTVMRFNGANWVNVGSPGFSAGTADNHSLAIYGGTPYVAYRDAANGNKTMVMKFDGINWINAGSPGFSAGSVSYLNLAFNGSTPYVAYSDGENGSKTTVMKFDGANWVNVGSPGFSAGDGDYQSLAFYDGTPYVAYQDVSNGGKTTVMKFNAQDAGVTSIITPAPDSTFLTCPVSGLIAPQSIVRNFASGDISSFDVFFEITLAGTGIVYSEMITDYSILISGQSRTETFPATFDMNTTGNYTVKSWISSNLDTNSFNDTAYSAFTVIQPNFGGPEFGYYFANSTSGASCAPDQPIYYWEDTTGSTSLILNGVNAAGGLLTGDIDDGFFTLGNILGGDLFRYAGVDYDSFFVSTNGCIALTRENNSSGQLIATTPLALPHVNAPRPGIFPFWKDLDYGETMVPVNRLSYKNANGKLIITFDRAPSKINNSTSSDDYVSFQVILETSPGPTSDGLITVQFNEAGTSAGFLEKYYNETLTRHTAGIQNLAGDSAIQYRRVSPTVVIVGGPLFGSDLAFSFGTNDQVLPVELSSFLSSVNGNDVTLNWSTASELNNSGFDIERSSASGGVRGQTSEVWTGIGNVIGNGSSSSAHDYSFEDRNLASGKYNYRLKQIDFNGNFEYFNLSNEVNIGVPNEYTLSQNYPNPFNPSTNLEFGIPELGFVTLKVYDITGKEVMTLVNEQKAPGYYTVSFNGANLSSGIYFYTIKAGDFVSTKRMILLK